MASILRPQSYATDFGTLVARAHQAAVAQSATIISAANGIARQRERAGQQAADALFRLRLEDFQRQQFAQKTKIENARLSLAQDENRRVNELHPLNVRSAELSNQLNEINVDQAPLREAALRANIAGKLIGNQAAGTELQFLPDFLQNRNDTADLKFSFLDDELETQQRFNTAKTDLLESEAGLGVLENEAKLKLTTEQQSVLGDLHALAASPPSPERMIQGEALMGRLYDKHRYAISEDPELASVFNDHVERFGLPEHMKIQPGSIIPQAPEGFDVTGFQTSTSADGRQSSQTQFQRRDVNARPDAGEVNQRITALKNRRDNETAALKREMQQVDDEITSINRQLSAAQKDGKKDQAAKLQSDLGRAKNMRQLLNEKSKQVEDDTGKQMDALIQASRTDSFPGGMPSVQPLGPGNALLGTPQDFLSQFN